MRLKKIKLAGFKSFVDPTTIPFPDDMTAVVGPNGCGKSNVIDAVRWVLGESSAKNLRGDAMTDVIFNGSTARKPVSQCSVELVFDNSQGRIQGEYAGYNELSVKRIVTKEAKSSYLLNNAKCRRRDVTDLFLGTGLGPRSYAIIEQGMISRLIESKPQELRVFIEEAAGVSKYKERRRETETRIRHTKENLERLEDVRGELGQQLEKLQRQAAAANRYKELKKNERQYKVELAALRWLKHSKKVELLEADITQKNADIEAYVATQRNEEKDITLYKEQQSDLKQKISDIQQQLFKVSTDITRIEQIQIHTKQRQQQIQKDSQGLREEITDIEISQQQHIDTIEDLVQQIQLAEPEKELLDEEVEQAQLSLMASEEELSQAQHAWRAQDQKFNLSKQQAQSCHGKIQTIMSMQLRTQQRIGELKDELAMESDEDLGYQIEQCQEQILLKEQNITESAELVETNSKLENQYIEEQVQANQVQVSIQGELQSLQAQISALHALQLSSQKNSSLADLLDSHNLDATTWWQTLDIQTGWEKAFETVTLNWQGAMEVSNNSILESLNSQVGGLWAFADKYIDVIPADSLASKLNNKKVPVWLTHIMFAEDQDEATSLLSKLKSHQSVVTKEGVWFGPDWMISGPVEQEAGLLQRASQIKILETEKENTAKRLEESQLALQELKQLLDAAKEQHKLAKHQLDEHKQQWQEYKNQLQLFTGQQQQQLSRHSRLIEELNRYQETFEDEKQQLEELAMQAEELDQAVEVLQEQQITAEEDRERYQQNIATNRSKLESGKTNLHRLALHLQSIQGQHKTLTTEQQREQQRLETIKQNLDLLQAELAELAMPLEEQVENLQQYLDLKASLEVEQNHLSERLSEVEEKLIEAEKGQQGVTDKIQAMLTELQAVKLECEGYRVRANGFLEQVEEMQQKLQTVLDSMDDNADENEWQRLLDKTTASVSRLGAVNLAAVEEYEVQAQRKQHLDDQNDDLVSAMEILEQAIRKIDKETRTRFKETFDIVNDDLKMLFPKVFGGGSAYLALTDDDLLETGVTIMARPPGKKNSTIHLLSGGEKALTALSLVFAIFRLNPAPFCLLDEVDAPLDDANVGRFCKLVSEMSKSVQFIYITHNKIAMEMATHLTGVTMAEPGVSRMVAVDVEEAVAIANA
ncbi:chromosome segregation protein SMC [Paraglaciecola sp. 2405UD69-4]|uniref:chromosome segregation protein SMC n=1 Tax=Paraglaciecola sp. 2405UD69-4 TaxID=3391836 RepID=UPI0039C8E954